MTFGLDYERKFGFGHDSFESGRLHGIMEHIKNFIRKETVFVIALMCAIISAFFVKPSIEYAGYMDTNVLIILFCLMASVTGLKKYGAFDLVSSKVILRSGGQKSISITLILICFVLSMFVTNDVALIAFVPLTIYLSDDKRGRSLMYVITAETIAANLGSLVTPMGNPQNLFLYQYYNLGVGEFMKEVIPLGAISLLCVLAIAIIFGRSSWKSSNDITVRGHSKRGLVKFLVLFGISVATVMRLINPLVCLAVVILVLLLSDREVFGMVDYFLLLTFVCFFIISGNISSIPQIQELIGGIIGGHELIAGVALSQVISNVPAAIMLAGFTDSYGELIRGVDIGGLGTIVASLASLISFKYYSLIDGASKGRYLMIFTGLNVAVLAVLTLLFSVI